MFRYLTAGESHGPALIGILDGLPAGLRIDVESIDADLHARQGGYGRGGRMQIEADRIEFLAGLRGGVTLGSPIAVMIRNRDFENNRALMDPLHGGGDAITNPRPGHADYAGALKYRHRDLRNVLERASARETAMRVALGTICGQFLNALGVRTTSHVCQIGTVATDSDAIIEQDAVRDSPVRCADAAASKAMIAEIESAKRRGDTLGGAFAVHVYGLPAGVGANRQPDARLDAILAAALMSIQTIKAVEIGAGSQASSLSGSAMHDEFTLDDVRVGRASNRAGGIEGGMSNGEPILLRATVKPLATLTKPLASVNLHERKAARATVVRSDVCIVPAASIVGEAMVRLALCGPILEKYGGDSMEETLDNFHRSKAAAEQLFSPERTG